MKILGAVLESKKAGALAFTAAVAVFGPSFGLTTDQVTDVTKVAMAYLLSQGVADVGVHLANGKTNAKPPAG